MGLLEFAGSLLGGAREGALSYPKSSLSIKVSGRAAQFTATKGPAALGLRSWISRANNSLPVPLSPCINTVTSVAASFFRDLKNPQHDRTLADHASEVPVAQHLPFQLPVLLLQCNPLQRPLDRQPELVDLEWF